MALTFGDVAIGAAIGALSAGQGVALPGALLLGGSYDLAAASVYAVNPAWFPGYDPPTLEDALGTAVGVAAGWLIARALTPPGQRPSPVVTLAAAATALIPGVGRAPGRLHPRSLAGLAPGSF